VSWQWSDEDETALDDSQNRYLKGTLLPRSSPRRARSTVVSLLTGGGGNYNYFHWLYDVLPRIQLCSYFINDDAELLYLVPANNLTFQNDSLSILGIDRDRQISSLASPFILADRCLCSAHPNPYPNASRATPTWIIDFLRNKFLPAASESKFGSLVYIDRADSTNKRQLINDSEVQQQLSANGFESYRLSELSFRDQIRLFSRAKVIVGAHGTGLANLAFAPPGCVIYEIFSHRFQPTMYKSISDHIGGEWIPLIGSEDSGGNAKMSSIYLSSEMVQKIIDRVTSLHGHSARRSRAHS
jgi:capsular polysaccharide biosynthesis protein